MRTCVAVLVEIYLKIQNMIWKPRVSYVRPSDMPVRHTLCPTYWLFILHFSLTITGVIVSSLDSSTYNCVLGKITKIGLSISEILYSYAPQKLSFSCARA